MGKPSYIATNFISSATQLTSANVVTAWPLSNLFDKELAKPAAWNTKGLNLQIDAGAGASWNTLALCGHNFSQAATIQIKAGSAPNPSTVIATLTWQRETLHYASAVPRSERYIVAAVTDPTATENSRLGQVVGGLRVELPRARRRGFMPGREEHDIDLTSYRGQRHVYKLFGRYRREYTFRVVDEDELAGLYAFHYAAGGIRYPFLWLEDALNDPFSAFARKEPNLEPRELPETGDTPVYEYNLTILAESVGEAILE